VRRCETCGSPLDAEQRYCLTCGARAGEPTPQLRELQRRAAAGEAPDGAGTAQAGAEHAGNAGGSQPLRLPGPRISAVLVAAFVGFGAIVGSAAGGSGGLPARAVRLVSPASPSTSASTEAPSGAAEEGGSEGGGEEEAEATSPPAEETAGASTSEAASEQGSSESGAAPESHKGSEKPASAPAHKLSDIGHVFVVVLSDAPYASLFGPESAGRYLSSTLEHKGELLVSYDAIAHEQLPNGIALLSGQGPTAQTAANCPAYSPLTPGTASGDGQVLGDGCVYPATVETLPGELALKHLTWRAYVQGIAESPGQPGACAHPAPGAPDTSSSAGTYSTFRNPFVYFESIAQSPGCQTGDVGLSALKGDLASVKSTPSFSYVVPDRCHDASPSPCSPGAAAGPAAAGPLLEEVVGEILTSPAYRRDGLLVITADEAPSSGELADSSSCCGQPKYPNYTSPLFGQGGGQVGALLLSPFVKGGTTSSEAYDHYSLLRTIEDIFGVRHLGYSALPAVKPLAASLLNAPAH
jgi:phosphatidylinositol-3-phosphatase